jgi:hypothetical protein
MTATKLAAPMMTPHPYEALGANTDVPTSDAAQGLQKESVWTVILLGIGGCFLLLLNGQVFTNTLIFLGFALASSSTWLRAAIRSQQSRNQRLAFYVLFGHVFFIIVFAADMPDKYHWQQRFNEKTRDAREMR